MEDQTIVRQGLRQLLDLADDIEVAVEASDGEEAVRRIQGHPLDVVLLDYKLPKLSGLEVLNQLSQQGKIVPTIMLTTFDENQLVLDALRAGARGFLLKDVSLDELTHAIREVAAGRTAFKPVLTERILNGLQAVKNTFPSLDPPDPLTVREVEILRLMTGGYSNRQIAGALFLAEGTVKNHISSILSKLGVRDRTRAVLKGVELGYLN